MDSNFKTGNYVKVKDGLKAPDYESISMDGWKGQLIGIEGNLVDIKLDSKTLLGLPIDYLIRLEKDGYSAEEIRLEISDVEIVPKSECTKMDEQLAKSRLSWISLFEDNSKKYLEYFKGIDVDDYHKVYVKWIDYLTENLDFPLNVRVVETMRGGLKIGEKIKLLDFDSFDEMYGILGVGKSNRGLVTWPICDLEVIDKKTASYQPLKDYCIWFANR